MPLRRSIAEMRFVLEEMAGIEEVAPLPGYETDRPRSRRERCSKRRRNLPRRNWRR